MSTSGTCGRLRALPGEAQIGGPTCCRGLVPHHLLKNTIRTDGCCETGWGGKVKQNETISHMENRLNQHWALIETANALQRQHNPGVRRQLHVVNYQIINADC